jgi:NifU-like protein involved in Fe-S cluster formation/TusA-related sulfurtransferase
MSIPSKDSHLTTADVWDAVDLGCGELVIELRGRLRSMPGEVLRVIALDPGAPEDIPAWCRLTGNRLVRYEPDTSSYWIRARGERSNPADKSSSEADTKAVDFDHVYSPGVFALAKSLPRDSRLDKPCATATARSRLCGSTIEIDVATEDGAVTDYAHRVKACLLGRASAAGVARNIVGASVDEVRQVIAEMRAMLEDEGPALGGRFAELTVLRSARVLKARHASMMLPFSALKRAIAGSHLYDTR